MKERLEKIIPQNMRLPLVWALVFNCIAYYGTRIIMSERYHHDISNDLDAKVPFLPWTAAIYLGCYVFWAINYILGCQQKEQEVFRFISADFAAKIVCMICFIVFPTTNVRPVIEGNSFWEQVMMWLYQNDAADNLFPSIHCLTSWFCFIAVRKNEKIPCWYKAASVIFAISVCISTLTTKQHVWIDVVAGVALAEGSYWFVEKSRFCIWYTHAMSKVYSVLECK